MYVLKHPRVRFLKNIFLIIRDQLLKRFCRKKVVSLWCVPKLCHETQKVRKWFHPPVFLNAHLPNRLKYGKMNTKTHLRSLSFQTKKYLKNLSKINPFKRNNNKKNRIQPPPPFFWIKKIPRFVSIFYSISAKQSASTLTIEIR